MTYPLFLIPRDSVLSLDAPFRLDGDEGRHAATVKRMRLGEKVDLTDGQGTRAHGDVIGLGKDWLELQITDIAHEPKPKLEVTVVQAIAKGERAELSVELMTEVGVWQIIPWQAAHSVARWDSSEKHRDKWARTAREAAKQSRRAWVPEVEKLHTTKDIQNLIPKFDAVYVLHESAQNALVALPHLDSGSVLCVVGPEGGISADELEIFQSAGAHIVRMGPSVLRTSTAGAVATAVLLSKTTDWL